MKIHPSPPTQLHLGFLPDHPPGTPDWESFPRDRRAAALRRLARLIARAVRPARETIVHD